MLGDNVLDAESSGIKGEDRGILILTGEGSKPVLLVPRQNEKGSPIFPFNPTNFCIQHILCHLQDDPTINVILPRPSQVH